jgi:DegV family protein with EDD domain
MLENLRRVTEGLFTIDTLRYLIHGGRISHLRGLVASLLNIKPVIGVAKDTGKYYTLAQERTMRRAIQKMGETVTKFAAEGSKLRVQLIHGKNPEGIEILRERMAGLFDCHWVPTMSVAPVLGAHTGGGVVGMSIAPMEAYAEVLSL